MSEKKSRQDRKEVLEKLKTINAESDSEAVAKEMEASIGKMQDDMVRKAFSAKERLISQLRVTVDKYRTANGVMSAMQVVRDVCGTGSMGLEDELACAKAMATRMAIAAQDMADKADGLEPERLGEVIEGAYDAGFSEGSGDEGDLIYQLLVLQLCQNVGPAAEDVADFCATASEEIAKAEADLADYREEHGLAAGE